MDVIVIDLNQGERVAGSFSVIDGSVYFHMEDPNGNVVIEEISVSDGSTFEHTAEKNGAYTLVFLNTSNRYEKIVTVSYDLGWFGSATALFANPLVWIQSVIIIILLAIIAVLIRRSRSRENKRVETSAQLC